MPELAEARPGAAFLAVESEVRILPVALSGTENIWINLSRFRRTPVTITIGEAFGPFKLEAEARGRTRREQAQPHVPHDHAPHRPPLPTREARTVPW
ncbi:MAG: hypothetical protein R2856_20625 [Caldilineaceae bacterium]